MCWCLHLQPVYDNSPGAKRLAWQTTGLVEYKYFVGHHSGARSLRNRTFKKTGQGYAYTECINSAKHRHRWLAFIDADEFLVVNDPVKQNINTFMKDYEAHAGLGVNWVTFGSSGHPTKPAGSTLTQYTRCFPKTHKNERHIKTIVNTAFILGIGTNPHYFNYANKSSAVSENKQKITGAFTKQHSSSKIALHHYTVKSWEEYKNKVARGGGSGAVKNMDYLRAVDVLATEVCTAAVEKGRQCCE